MSQACVICGGSLRLPARPLHCAPPVVGGEIRVCERCGSGQVTPLPSPGALAAQYDRDYYETYGGSAGMAGGDEAAAPHLRDRLDRITARRGAGRLVDLGCGLGLFVAYARSRGWEASGVEASEWAAAEARRRLGIEVHHGTFEDAPIAPGSLDIVHANHVLEHLPDPVATLTTVAMLLAPGGELHAEVPQEHRRTLGEMVLRLRHPRRSEPLGPNHHLVFLTPSGIRIALQRAGLELVSLRGVRHDGPPAGKRAPIRALWRAVYAIEPALGLAPAYEIVARRPD